MPTKKRQPKKVARSLEAQLLAVLGRHCGERGDNEGAVETLERIIRERDGKAKAPKVVQIAFHPSGQVFVLYDDDRVFVQELKESANGLGKTSAGWFELPLPPRDIPRPPKGYRAQPKEFIECDECRKKPGTPMLCADCLRRRDEFYGHDTGNSRFANG